MASMTFRLRRQKTWQDHARSAVSSAWFWLTSHTNRKTAAAAGGAAAVGTAAVVAAARHHSDEEETSPDPAVNNSTPHVPAGIS